MLTVAIASLVVAQPDIRVKITRLRHSEMMSCAFFHQKGEGVALSDFGGVYAFDATQASRRPLFSTSKNLAVFNRSLDGRWYILGERSDGLRGLALVGRNSYDPIDTPKGFQLTAIGGSGVIAGYTVARQPSPAVLEGQTIVPLPLPPNGAGGDVNWVSDDGTVIVGSTKVNGKRQYCRWVNRKCFPIKNSAGPTAQLLAASASRKYLAGSASITRGSEQIPCIVFGTNELKAFPIDRTILSSKEKFYSTLVIDVNDSGVVLGVVLTSLQIGAGYHPYLFANGKLRMLDMKNAVDSEQHLTIARGIDNQNRLLFEGMKGKTHGLYVVEPIGFNPSAL